MSSDAKMYLQNNIDITRKNPGHDCSIEWKTCNCAKWKVKMFERKLNNTLWKVVIKEVSGCWNMDMTLLLTDYKFSDLEAAKNYARENYDDIVGSFNSTLSNIYPEIEWIKLLWELKKQLQIGSYDNKFIIEAEAKRSFKPILEKTKKEYFKKNQ